MTLFINYLVHIIAVFGAAYVVGHSQISLAPRELLARNRVGLFFVQLLECPACFSFHAGWLLTLRDLSLFSHTATGALGAAFFYAGTSYLLARLTGLMGPAHQRDEFFVGAPNEKHITEV